MPYLFQWPERRETTVDEGVLHGAYFRWGQHGINRHRNVRPGVRGVAREWSIRLSARATSHALSSKIIVKHPAHELRPSQNRLSSASKANVFDRGGPAMPVFAANLAWLQNKIMAGRFVQSGIRRYGHPRLSARNERCNPPNWDGRGVGDDRNACERAF